MFNNSNPEVEQAMNTLQTLSPATVEAIQSYLVTLTSLETRIGQVRCALEAHEVDEVKQDGLRGIAGLRSEMRRYIGLISDALAVPPRRDTTRGFSS